MNMPESLCTFLHVTSILSCLPPQAKPREVQAIREFAEPRKLTLLPNDLVTVIDHRWVSERWVGGTKEE